MRAALERAEQDAITDALTGCLNRRGWRQALDLEERRCRRHDLDAVVLVIDLDGLKDLNDSQGHAAGDRRLVSCAEALRAVVRAEDTVARLGGDEFGVLAVQTGEDAEPAVASRIVRAFGGVGPKATVGCARRCEFGSLTAAVEAADRRMLEQKSASRSEP